MFPRHFFYNQPDSSIAYSKLLRQFVTECFMFGKAAAYFFHVLKPKFRVTVVLSPKKSVRVKPCSVVVPTRGVEASSVLNTFRLPSLITLVLYVHSCRAKKQMSRVTAGRIVAMMTNKATHRIDSSAKKESDSVGTDSRTIDCIFTVPSTVFTNQPIPTIINLCSLDVAPKPCSLLCVYERKTNISSSHDLSLTDRLGLWSGLSGRGNLSFEPFAF